MLEAEGRADERPQVRNTFNAIKRQKAAYTLVASFESGQMEN